MKKSTIRGLLIGTLMLDSAIIFTLVKRYKKDKKLLEKEEYFSNRKYTKLGQTIETEERLTQNYTNRKYIRLEKINEKKAM